MGTERKPEMPVGHNPAASTWIDSTGNWNHIGSFILSIKQVKIVSEELCLWSLFGNMEWEDPRGENIT